MSLIAELKRRNVIRLEGVPQFELGAGAKAQVKP